VDTVSAIAMITAKITGATTNAIVVLVAVISRLEKKCLYCQGRVSHSRYDLHFRLQFISCLIRAPVHNRISADVQLLSKI
jgi:hypothetical protein